jgi:hypothetical protein
MKGWKRKVALTRQKGAVASSMRNLVMKGASCDYFTKPGILVETFAYWHYLGLDNQFVVGGRLLLAVQEVNVRYCFLDIPLKESPSVESGSPSSYPSRYWTISLI